MHDAHKLVVENCFEITLNANDFFSYNSADCIKVDADDLEWILPIVEKYGQYGIDAAMAYIRNKLPIDAYLTEKFNIAHQELIKLSPVVSSK